MRRGSSVAPTSVYLAVLASASSLWTPANARAAWVESLVMPGDVIAKHARVEHDCDKCHERFDKAAQDRLCAACHTDVAADLSEKRGLHGKEPSVSGQPCKTCHTEHKGRAASIVRLDQGTFQHRLTDLPLRGRHVTVPCTDCHAPGSRYREASSECEHCHAVHDPHDGSLGVACDDCHQEASWKEVRFDHGATAFPLQGRHREAPCEDCHATKRYKPTSNTCHSCHARDDKHGGRLGAACDSCHGMETWSTAAFDHARRTRFPLLGRHATARCEGCHTEGPGKDIPTTCDGCHARDDVHRGKFGRNCATCHPPLDWRSTTFVHDRDTDYALRGRHALLRCDDCHRRNPYLEDLDSTCYACHRDDDAHRGHEGTHCERCHDERGWRRDVLFDHDLTRFPLLGSHNRVPCADCHRSAAFKDVQRDCLSCHADDDPHRGRWGNRCSDCHNPADWRAWDFDHNARTDFRLDGAHAEAACEACHHAPGAEPIALSRRCVDCHEPDDVHRGGFGALCERCHETSTFRNIRNLR